VVTKDLVLLGEVGGVLCEPGGETLVELGAS